MTKIKSYLMRGLLSVVVLVTAGVLNASAQSYLQSKHCESNARNLELFLLGWGATSAEAFAYSMKYYNYCIESAIEMNNTAMLKLPEDSDALYPGRERVGLETLMISTKPLIG